MMRKILNRCGVILENILNLMFSLVWKRRVMLYKVPSRVTHRYVPETEYLVVVEIFTIVPPFTETAIFNIYCSPGWTSTVPAVPALFGMCRNWMHENGWHRTSFLDILTTRGISKIQIFEELAKYYGGTWRDFKEPKL